jgi:spore germination protein Q
MNNNYFDKSVFPGKPIYSSDNMPTTVNNTPPGNYNYTSQLPMEQSYIENILRMNKGKQVTVHMTFPDSEQFRDREFKGIIEQSGRDHIVLSDPSNGKWYLLLMIYVDFLTFDEKINYITNF